MNRCPACGKFHRPPVDCRPLNTATAAHLKPTARLLLGLLRRAGSHGMLGAELANAGVGFRYSARAMELREAGFGLTTERLTNTVHKFTLTHDPDVEVERGPSTDPAHPPVPVRTDGVTLDLNAGTLFDVPRVRLDHYGRNAA